MVQTLIGSFVNKGDKHGVFIFQGVRVRPHCISVDMTSYSDRLHFSTSGEFLDGDLWIDFDMGLLKGGSPDDIDSCRTSFETIAMTGESLMRHLFEFSFFLHFFS